MKNNTTKSNDGAVSLPESGFVRLAQLVPAIVPVSKATIWRRVKMGTFPRPVKIGPRTTAWRVEQVRASLRNPQTGM